MLTELTEYAFTDVPAGRIDRESGIIRGVKILGRQSKNAGGAREYSAAAIQEAAGRYEGMEVNIDHPKGVKSAVRNLIEGWGVIRDARVGSDGAYGDLHYLKNHPSTPWLLERIERDMQVGLSHNARGTCRIQNGREIVESVPVVFSADLVSRPATVKSLFESTELNEGDEMKSRTEPARRSLLAQLRGGSSHQKSLQEMTIDAPARSSSVLHGNIGDDQIKQAIVAAINAKLEGVDVVTLKLIMSAMGIEDSITKNIAGKTSAKSATDVSESVRYVTPSGRYVDIPASWMSGTKAAHRNSLKARLIQRACG